MFKLRFAIVSLCVAMLWTAAPTLHAKEKTEAPNGPIPAQILAAQKVFIANAGGGIANDMVSGGPNRFYNEFYASMKTWGHYQLVDSPSQADMVLQISLSRTVYGIVGQESEIRLELRDPKSNDLLWSFDEAIHIHGLGTRGSIDKGIDEAMDKILDDLKALTAQPSSAAK